MAWLIAGVLLWSIVHLIPSLAPQVRTALVGRLGENTYKALFSIDMLIAIILIVIGWRTAAIELLYSPPLYGSPAIPVLMLLSFVLFGAANAPGNLKRMIRHPMLTGMALWGIAHLLANGDNRSTILFGGMTIWAVLEIFALNHRDGEWIKPDEAPFSRDLMTVFAGAILFAIVFYIHEKAFGVPPVPGFQGL